MLPLAHLSGYKRLEGEFSVAHRPGMRALAAQVRLFLRVGAVLLSEMLDVEEPELQALLVADEDWNEAPRENAPAYPLGLPYFTRSVRPPALVLPEKLSPIFRPRTEPAYPLAIWHELAHAFLLQSDVVRTPAWLREFVPQAASAAVARGVGIPLYEEYLSEIEREPGFTIRSLKGPADADRQMAFQNLLLLLGWAAVEEFGDGFLKKLVHALWEEKDIVNEERAEELLADALGPGGRAWIRSRPEF